MVAGNISSSAHLLFGREELMFRRSVVLALVFGGASLFSPLLAVNHVVQVVNNAFNPSQLTIQAGDTVTFQKANTSVAHNVVSDAFIHDGGCTFGPTCFECGEGNGCSGQGASGELTTSAFNITLSFFNEAGTFPYYCENHGAPNGRPASPSSNALHRRPHRHLPRRQPAAPGRSASPMPATAAPRAWATRRSRSSESAVTTLP